MLNVQTHIYKIKRSPLERIHTELHFLSLYVRRGVLSLARLVVASMPYSTSTLHEADDV